MRRRGLLGAAAALCVAIELHAQSGVWPEWLGTYSGTLRFYRSIPLEDIYPPPQHPRVDLDDPTPFAVFFSIRSEIGGTVVWLRIDGGPMQTSQQGETLRFGPAINGFAPLIDSQANPALRSANLIVRPDSVGTEALLSHADGSFWRRHFTARFTPASVDLIVWVFDAAGTRARTWRGSAVRRLP